MSGHFMYRVATRTVSLNLLLLLLTLQVVCTVVSAAQTTSSIQIVTQHFPPLQYQKEDQPSGYVHDYITAVLTKVQQDHNISIGSYQFLPWKRAFQKAKLQPNTLFFSLSRTPQREQQFHWLGTVSPYRQFFFSYKKEINLADLNALKNSNYIVGVQAGSSLEQLLKELGFTHNNDYVTYSDYHQGVKMLFKDRIDMIPLTGFLARSTVCGMGYNGNQIRPILPIDELAKPLWAVLSLDTPKTLVSAFKQAMLQLKENGFYQQNIDKHLDAWQSMPCHTSPDV